MLLLPASAPQPFGLGPDSERLPMPRCLRLQEGIGALWQHEAERLAVEADSLVTLHIAPQPPAWYLSRPTSLNRQLNRWKNRTTLLRTLCCADLAEALLLGTLLQSERSVHCHPDALVQRLATTPRRHAQWQRSIPGVWTFKSDQGRQWASRSRLQQQLLQHTGEAGLALRHDGGFWTTREPASQPDPGIRGTACALQIED
ncbi:MAG: hypothetical protein LAT62_14665 [Natronospirillum sp.]|uniref:hypothetical protein n=1 Tax=Natronospirillum sp. TaxID=2812955 RepID=UPI0025DCA47A|nr:hypothetical protein [Natronospirillum sp.]MCH8553178.1 hypothetical protein [Natronospirillum sp.]